MQVEVQSSMQVSGSQCMVTVWVWWSMKALGVVVNAGDHGGNC